MAQPSAMSLLTRRSHSAGSANKRAKQFKKKENMVIIAAASSQEQPTLQAE